MNLARFKSHDDFMATALRYRAVFGTTDGKEVLRDILKILYVFNSDTPDNAPEIMGKRNAGCEIIEMLGCLNDQELTLEGMIEGLINNVPMTNPKIEEVVDD